MTKKMLIIEDEMAIGMALEDDFLLEGYEVKVSRNGRDGLELALQGDFDIILLDIMLPGLDGVEVCKALRKHELRTPVIMLSAKSQEIDKILGLEIGADDYVTKPFSPRELQARVKAILRRSDSRNKSNNNEVIKFGNVSVNLRAHEILKNGKPIKLTALEFSLLKYFILNNHTVVSRDDILDHVWNESVIVDPRTVDTHVANLRKKIENAPSTPTWILSVRGVGYKFVLK